MSYTQFVWFSFLAFVAGAIIVVTLPAAALAFYTLLALVLYYMCWMMYAQQGLTTSEHRKSA